jgi:putative membrane protein
MGIIKMNFSGDNPSILSSRFWVKTLLMAISIFITCYLFSFAKVDGVIDALLAAILISLLNASLKPILVLLSMPLMVTTLGLFNLVINAIIILLTSYFLKGFEVNGFWDAILFSIIITTMSFILDLILKLYQAKKQVEDSFKANKNDNNTEEKVEETDYEDVTDKD